MGTTHNTIESLLNEHEVAEVMGLSLATIRRRRILRQDPKYIKIGKSVRYTPESIREFVATRPTGGGQAEAR
jgi:predicted DNA-binding transcriptional regulator AlpA